MAVLGARPFLSCSLKPHSSSSSCCGTAWRGLEDRPTCSVASIASSSSSTSVNFGGCLSSNAAEVNDRFWSSGRACSSSASGKLGGSSFRLLVVGRAGGSRPPAGARRPRITGPRRTPQDEQQQSDGPLLNDDIRVPAVRLLDEEQNMVGVVPTQEALQRSRDADLDLVMISPDADPPVCRIMDYSKYRYELQKKKREAQKKAAASRQELKELKMRYNIDTHDYDVRLRAAKRFLQDGDKVKVVCQFKGREMDFKNLAFKLFQRFSDDIGELGVTESKMAIEGRQMLMTIGPNKTAVAKLQAQAQSAADKLKSKGQEVAKSEAPESEDAVANVEAPKSEEPASV